MPDDALTPESIHQAVVDSALNMVQLRAGIIILARHGYDHAVKRIGEKKAKALVKAMAGHIELELMSLAAEGLVQMRENGQI